MSDKLIEAFLKMHGGNQLDERLVSDKQRQTKLAPAHTQGIKQTKAITAREPEEPAKSITQKAAEIGRGIEAGARGVAAGATDLSGFGIGSKPLSQYVTDFVTPGREKKLQQEFPRVSDVAKQAGEVGSVVSGLPGIIKGIAKIGVKTVVKQAAKQADDVAPATAKGIDGEILSKGAAGPRSGYKDITPSSSTAVTKTASEVKPTTPPKPQTSVSKPSSTGVGPAMKTVDDVPPKLGAPSTARALPSAADTSKALGGFGKVPMGKMAAAGAGAIVTGAALTAGSKPAGEVAAKPEPSKAATSEPSKAATTPAPKTEAPKQEKYKIAKGDTLSDLAKKWNVSVGDIAKANQGIKDVNKIQAGAELVRPSATGAPVYQGGIGTKAGPSKSQNIQKPKLKTETTEMSNKLIDSFLKLQDMHSSNIFEAAKKVKKLDKVGKEDEDIDNDGDKDKSDSYLHNRRKAIAKAMKEAKDPYAELDAPSSGGKAPATTTDPEWKKKMKPQEQTPTRNLKGSLPKGVSVKEEAEELDEAKKSVFSSEQHKKFELMNRSQRGEYHEKLAKMARNHEEASMRDHASKAAGEFRRKYLKPQYAMTEEAGDKHTHIAFMKNFETKKETAIHVPETIGKGLRKSPGGVRSAINDHPEVKKLKSQGWEVDRMTSVEGTPEEAHEKSKKALSGPKLISAFEDEHKSIVRDMDKAMKLKDAHKSMKEEVEFSEAELAHIASILEATPIAPVPDDYSGPKNGASKRDLTDEKIIKHKTNK